MSKKENTKKDEPLKVYGSFEDVIKVSVTPQPVKMKIFEKDKDGFELVYVDPNSGGRVLRHELALKTISDYNEVYEVATDYAKLGSTVKILPDIHFKDPLRETIFPGAKERKCPDLSIDGEYTDIKTPTGSLSNACIDRNIQKGHEQAKVVIIRIAGDMSYTRLKFLAKNRLDRHPDLDEVRFKVKGKYHNFNRKSI